MGKVPGQRHTQNYMEKIHGKPEMYRRFADAYVKTGHMEDAVEIAYEGTISQKQIKAYRLMKKPEVREAMKMAFESRNATPTRAAELVADATMAEKRVGDGENAIMVPDHGVRLRAADMIMKAFGAYDDKPSGFEGGSKHLHIYMQEPMPVQKFILQNQRVPTEEERKQLLEGLNQ
jgi:hypothetical protein